MKSVIVGTAGHIDHGKTALVKALTGIDADRLEEEKRRGITIDLGFAHLELPAPDGEPIRFGFVDVPGHERFVRNMLAGVGGIDLVLLVIAADESIKPQTREHFDICRLLSIPRGITVLTKSDLVDRETLDVVRLEVEDFLKGSFLEGSPIIPVSALKETGLNELKQALARMASEVPARDANALPRLPIDRVFTMKGFGTVVTGTLVAGTVQKETELESFPHGKRVRVRGVQVHGQSSEQAQAGQRTALNLAGVATDDLRRGMMLAPPATLHSTSRVDVSLSLLASAKPLKDRARVHLHSYTSEVIAEVVLYGKKQIAPGESAFAQLRLAEPLLFLPGDRFIIRQFSPVITIGGGVVVDTSPLTSKQKADERMAYLEILQKGAPEEVVLARVGRRANLGLTVAALIAETGWTESRYQPVISALQRTGSVVRAGDTLIAAEVLRRNSEALLATLVKFHNQNPLVAGIGREALREVSALGGEVFSAVADLLVHEKKIEFAGELVRLPGRGVVMKNEEAESKKIIESAFAKAGLAVPSLNEVLAGLKVDKVRAQKIVTLLLRDKVLVKLSDTLVFHHTALADLRQRMAAQKAKSPRIDVAKFKDLTGVSRKYAIPLLEYLDRERVTKRVGDERVIL
ncbi:MAG TPA: selenocysteine-specific translation elongation factor [Terriglobales bacterium]|nr:selenocysteine-specific translation elongation factor [Terriglobales bacterium]